MRFVTDEDSKKQYKKWKRRLRLPPKELSKTQKSKKLIPIYSPYWLYHLECHGEARFHAVTTSTIMEETQDKAVETRHYELYRQGQICLPEYPICASGKIDERLTAQLPSYDFKEKQPFQIQHLSGCLSEKYHSSDQDLQPNAENAAKTEMDRFLMSALTGYDSVSVKERDYHVTVCSAEYILCPAWLAFCDTADPDYMFLLNAQNGKPASQPPISGIKAGAVIFLVAVFAFILFRILTVVLGGPLL